MKTFIENHFGFVLVLSCFAGLVVPGLPSLPDNSAIITLAMLTFVSCYRLHEGGFSAIAWRDVGLFCILRYMLLPLALWALALLVAPDYAMGIFLLALLPSAVSSPAFCTMFGGRVPNAFAIVVISTLASPLLIPLQFALIGSAQIAPSPLPLFATLAWCVFAPMIVSALVRKQRALAGFINGNHKMLSIVLVAFIIALVIAKQRELILGNLAGLLAPFTIVLLCFASFIFAGLLFGAKKPREERVTYAVCSGFNNAAMGVSLALVHFSPQVVLFVAVSEMGWALLPLMMRVMLRPLSSLRKQGS